MCGHVVLHFDSYGLVLGLCIEDNSIVGLHNDVYVLRIMRPLDFHDVAQLVNY